MINITVWNEFKHEKDNEQVKAIYPDGIHGTIKAFLQCEDDFCVRTATLDEPECGLTQEVLDNTDVLLWWGHMAHDKVPDEVAVRVQNAVLNGMGFIPLHSAHHSKPFRLLMGTPCHLSWREHGDLERVWIIDPSHPITQGLGRYFEIEHEEMYGEPFTIPEPEKLLMIGWYDSGEVFRSGALWERVNGKIFYFQPGHETNCSFQNEHVQRIIKNAVKWACPVQKNIPLVCPNFQPLEK